MRYLAGAEKVRCAAKDGHDWKVCEATPLLPSSGRRHPIPCPPHRWWDISLDTPEASPLYSRNHKQVL